jgi:hypothetical protein
MEAARSRARDNVGDDGLDQDQQAAATQPLNGSGHDQPGHVGRQATEHASGHENRQRGDEQRLASQQVAELSVYRHHHRSRQEVSGRHPQHAVHPAEFADDGRQSGGEHGLIQFRQQEAKHQPEIRSYVHAVSRLKNAAPKPEPNEFLEEPKNNKPTDEDYERQAIDLVKEKSHSLICCESLRFCAMSIWTVSILSSILTFGIVLSRHATSTACSCVSLNHSPPPFDLCIVRYSWILRSTCSASSTSLQHTRRIRSGFEVWIEAIRFDTLTAMPTL